MKSSNRGFYKGIAGFTREREEDLGWKAEGGIYGWWWQYLQLSPVFWFARTTGIALKHPQLAKVFDEAGDLGHDNFKRWWDATGSRLYVEAVRPRQVRLVEEDKLEEFVFYPKGKSIVVEIPLTISQGTINRKIREILAAHHQGRALNVMEHSNAQWPLHTKRFALATIEKEYWTLLYRMLYPNIAAWRIGDRLKLARGLNLRDLDRWKFKHMTSPLDRMNSTIGRYLYKAKWTLWNAEQGTFPNANKITPVEKPFGAKHHDEYLDATDGRLDSLSPWQEWLHHQYHASLVNRVRDRCKITGMSAINLKTQQLLPKFIAGETDLLA